MVLFLADVTPLDRSIYQTGGMTNLYDTVYTALKDDNAGVLVYANKLFKWYYPKVAVVVFTDGADNDSS